MAAKLASRTHAKSVTTSPACHHVTMRQVCCLRQACSANLPPLGKPATTRQICLPGSVSSHYPPFQESLSSGEIVVDIVVDAIVDAVVDADSILAEIWSRSNSRPRSGLIQIKSIEAWFRSGLVESFETEVWFRRRDEYETT